MYHNGIFCPCCGMQLRTTPIDKIGKEKLIKNMSLFPNEDILTKEIESWKKEFEYALRGEENSSLLFNKMLTDVKKVMKSILILSIPCK
jgi:hypothetical protein